MTFEGHEAAGEPSREQVDQMTGQVLLEFGASWCGHCQSLAPALSALMCERPDVRRIWIEDGPGRPLGRSFRVKLWPTLVFLVDGQVKSQLVRPEIEKVRDVLDDLGTQET